MFLLRTCPWHLGSSRSDGWFLIQNPIKRYKKSCWVEDCTHLWWFWWFDVISIISLVPRCWQCFSLFPGRMSFKCAMLHLRIQRTQLAGASNPPSRIQKSNEEDRSPTWLWRKWHAREDRSPSKSRHGPTCLRGEWQNLVVSCDIPEIVPHCPLQPRLTLPLHVQSWPKLTQKGL